MSLIYYTKPDLYKQYCNYNDTL